MDQQTSEKTKRSSKRSPPYALFNLLVIVVAIAYGAYHQMYLAKDATTASEELADVPTGEDEMEKIQLFTADELKKFDGVSKYHIILESD